MADEAVAIERSGVGHQFLGAAVLRAFLHTNLGEIKEARPLLDFAIETYPLTDHVYAETMTAWAYFVLARLNESMGDFTAAAIDFQNSVTVADKNDHRLAIGSHWVKSTLGLARQAHRRSSGDESSRLLKDAIDMLVNRPRFRWINLGGCSPGENWYEVAATHACRGEDARALDALQRAAQHGWSDLHQLAQDSCFDSLRGRDEFASVAANAKAQVTLPPPAGSGGFPELET
jgi:tetratricopeptide (TPR) repeat protein